MPTMTGSSLPVRLTGPAVMCVFSSGQSARFFLMLTTPPLQHVLKAPQTRHAKLSRNPTPPQHPFISGGAGLQVQLLQTLPPVPFSLLQTCPHLSIPACPSPAGCFYHGLLGCSRGLLTHLPSFTLPCPFQHPHSSQAALLKALNTVTTFP